MIYLGHHLLLPLIFLLHSQIMIYLVTGYMRSGTSMMMSALMAGGIEGVYDDSRDDDLRPGTEDEYYKINPSVFEPSTKQTRILGFPREHDGKCLKILWGGVGGIATASYRIVFMWRNAEEIRQSYEGGFLRSSTPQWWSEDGYKDRMNLGLDLLRNRKDVHSITELNYRDVIARPIYELSKLKEDGWPINVTKAASVVDEKQCRFKIEDLVVGM